LVEHGAARRRVRARLRGVLPRAAALAFANGTVHYPPIHTFSAYRETAWRRCSPTDGVAPRLLTLALYGRMTDDQVEAGIDALRAVL
jgi:dTDP-4-amino-4,6-dideoxygalactose transaminase